jgi:hypothetical protein
MPARLIRNLAGPLTALAALLFVLGILIFAR